MDYLRGASEGVGKGTAFTVTIPLLAEGTLGAGASERPPAGALATLAGLHGVVVDDVGMPGENAFLRSPSPPSRAMTIARVHYARATPHMSRSPSIPPRSSRSY